MSMAAVRKLVFAVNGERFELSDVDPAITLLEFLRTKTRFRGAKLGCGEGGCGACVVLLSTYDPISDQVRDISASSCLALLCSINFCSVTTTEGLRDDSGGLHSVHRRIAGFHASQCGFCTPGVCMSLFSALVSAENSWEPPPEGFSKLSAYEAERAVAGNLCRCTGYRSIVDACKSFAADVDLEDLGLNTFWKRGHTGDAQVSKLPPFTPGSVCTFPDFLKSEIRDRHLASNSDASSPSGCRWYRPASIGELHDLMSSLCSCGSPANIKMVVGNTSSGVYKELYEFNAYVDLRGIPELTAIKSDEEGVEIGAAVTISQIVKLLKEESAATSSSVFGKLADHMNKVASQFVRNTASVGGNLVMAQRNRFPSDIAAVLLAVNSTVRVENSEVLQNLTLQEFLEGAPCDPRTVLLSIFIPRHASSSVLFETYRASPRPLGNAVAYLTSAFLAQVSPELECEGFVLDHIQLAFGCPGSNPAAFRAWEVETFLAGKRLTVSQVLEACKILKTSAFSSGDDDARHAAYISSLAVSFLFSFLHPLMQVGRPLLNDLAASSNTLLCCSQVVPGHCKDFEPVGEPAKKCGAELQASGEAIYVDDIPSPEGCLYGAFIYSRKPHARINRIELDLSLKTSKKLEILTACNIPEGGSNTGASTIFGSELLFADSIAEYAGQPLGIVLAETQRLANMASKLAIVEYDTAGLEPPILSIEDAVNRDSCFQVPTFIYPKQVCDPSAGMDEADYRIADEVNIGSQYFFYMETQTALAVPDEDSCMVVYTSSQCPETAQGVIARCLGIPFSNVRVITRRVGGGFGGKAVRSLPVATACALAAHKLRRPVRMYLDRKTDMVMMGGRHPMKVLYSVGFKADGKITALQIDLFVDAGATQDISPVMPHNFVGALKKYNWGALSVKAGVYRTNLPTKSSMRAPGEVQGSYVAEAIIERVAVALAVDPDAVRRSNLHSVESLGLFYDDCAEEELAYTLPSIMSELKTSSDYARRGEFVRCFNNSHRWKKRGISCLPIVHKVTVRPTPSKVSVLNDGSVVVEVGGIELGQGLWTKVKQMAAFGLAQLWSDGSQKLMDRVRVIQADTLSLIQGGWTAGSTTSESSCEAVRVACNMLTERLKPVKKNLEAQHGTVSWDTLVKQAASVGVNLSANTLWVPDLGSMNYLNYGAAVSEVEVDLLTGATTILRSDLIYDCGQSLNPAVDLGQVEGAFVQGIGFFMNEEHLSDSEGLVISDSTWSYKIPTVDTVPGVFNVQLVNSGPHRRRVLSSKASGEPPLLLAASVHCATRAAVRAARSEYFNGSDPLPAFQLQVPATMPVVKELCGLNNVEKYLESLATGSSSAQVTDGGATPSF